MNRLTACVLFLLLGTIAGAETALVRDINHTGSSDPQQMIDVGGVVIFEAHRSSVQGESGTGGEGIWRSDGTEAGTIPLIEYPGLGLGVFTFVGRRLFHHEGLTYFVANGGCTCGELGRELWVTDGTVNGTTVFKDINPGSDDGIKTYNNTGLVPDLVLYKGLIYFAADNGVNGFELWRTDGTNAGTEMFLDIFPGADDAVDLPRLTVVGDTLFFFAKESEAVGTELWKTDGTVAGTMMVKDINPNLGETVIPGVDDTDRIIAASNDKLFFRGDDGNEVGLYVSDGTSAGTFRLQPTDFPTNGNIDSLTVWRNKLYLRADRFMWTSDGTLQGTVRFDQPNLVFSFLEFTEMNGELYFEGDSLTGNFGDELWKTDGTEAGTMMAVNINPMGDSDPKHLTNVNGTLYFSARVDLGTELYRSDGTPQGTYLVADLVPGAGGFQATPSVLTPSRGGLFFQAEHPTGFRELFYSCCDGALKTSINVVSDTNNNGAGDIALTSKNQSGATQLRVHDSSTGSLLRQPTFFGPSWVAKDVISYDTGNTTVLGLVALEESGLLGIQLKDAATGNAIRNLFPWSANWHFEDAAIADGVAPGGGPGVAILATRKSDGLMGVELRNPDDNTRIRIIYPLGFGWYPLALDTLTANGETAIAVLSTRDVDQLTIVQVRKSTDGTLIKNVFPLGFGWSPVELKIMPDLNGNGVDEIAVRMTRDSDGLMIIQVRDGSTNALIGNVYPIGAGGNGWTTHQFQALNVNGNIALVILSVRDSDKQILLQSKDVQTGAILKNNFFIGPPWKLRESFAVIPHYGGGPSDEIAVPVRNTLTGQELIQIRDAFDTSVIRNVFVP